ncbi:uncharacterized protein METZ01_LOCUS333357 [marine metagenome]|uniref:Uncharacterized protein n=1 Tax=marine metagenome TaxID=408172 RepID=A0A382Q4H1_9ZZZZ
MVSTFACEGKAFSDGVDADVYPTVMVKQAVHLPDCLSNFIIAGVIHHGPTPKHVVDENQSCDNEVTEAIR